MRFSTTSNHVLVPLTVALSLLGFEPIIFDPLPSLIPSPRKPPARTAEKCAGGDGGGGYSSANGHNVIRGNVIPMVAFPGGGG